MTRTEQQQREKERQERNEAPRLSTTRTQRHIVLHGLHLRVLGIRLVRLRTASETATPRDNGTQRIFISSAIQALRDGNILEHDCERVPQERGKA